MLFVFTCFCLFVFKATFPDTMPSVARNSILSRVKDIKHWLFNNKNCLVSESVYTQPRILYCSKKAITYFFKKSYFALFF